MKEEEYKITRLNNVYLEAILQQQLELKALLKGKTDTEIKDYLMDAVGKMQKSIYDIANGHIQKDLDDLEVE